MDWYGPEIMGRGRRGGNQQFSHTYHCRSTSVAGLDVQDGDKIFLPPSALDKLARLNVEYPMLFEITNNVTGRRSHCGVLEFSAEEGYCYMPFWMMENLATEENGLVTVRNVSLPKATFVKFQAQSCDFLEVTNPRALLEVALRKFTCLSEGDMICIPHAGKRFYLEVRQVLPPPAASIIETDCNVDFDEPLGYKDSKYAKFERRDDKQTPSDSNTPDSSFKARVLQRARMDAEQDESSSSFKAFAGPPKRIDGKQSKATADSKDSKDEKPVAAAPATDSKPTAVTYQSRIGDKFSKKKASVAAFAGQAHKLSS